MSETLTEYETTIVKRVGEPDLFGTHGGHYLRRRLLKARQLEEQAKLTGGDVFGSYELSLGYETIAQQAIEAGDTAKALEAVKIMGEACCNVFAAWQRAKRNEPVSETRG